MIGRKTVLALVLVASALWGCATREKYEAALQLWIGQREETLVAGWGTPQGFYEAGGTRYLTFSNKTRWDIPGTPPTYYAETIAGQTTVRAVGGTAPATMIRTCETTFVVRGGIVQSYTLRGDYCIAQ